MMSENIKQLYFSHHAGLRWVPSKCVYLVFLFESPDPEDRELVPLDCDPELREELLCLDLLLLRDLLLDGLRFGILSTCYADKGSTATYSESDILIGLLNDAH